MTEKNSFYDVIDNLTDHSKPIKYYKKPTKAESLLDQCPTPGGFKESFGPGIITPAKAETAIKKVLNDSEKSAESEILGHLCSVPAVDKERRQHAKLVQSLRADTE